MLHRIFYLIRCFEYLQMYRILEEIIEYGQFFASLVQNDLFRPLITTTGCVFSCRIQWYIWKCSTTIIKYLCTVNRAKKKKTHKQKYRRMSHRVCLRFSKKTDFIRFSKESLRLSFYCPP